MPATRWTDADRKRALALAREVGTTEASRRLGMPYGTVAALVSRDKARGVPDRFTPDATPDLTDDAPRWDGTQGETADRYGRVVRAFLTHVESLITQGRYKEARDAMVSAAIATDKAQLLSGHATTRSESRSLVVQATADRLRTIMDRLPPAARGLVVPSRVVSDQRELAPGTESLAEGAADGAGE